MSQQHSQFFEEEFRDGPPSPASYQDSYASPPPAPYTVNVSPQGQSYATVPGQKLFVHDLNSGQTNSTGARLALAIVSLVFVFIIYVIALFVYISIPSSVGSGMAVLFALAFSLMTLLINLIFNRKR